VRLDKFLQVSRLVRRRALAASLCHAGRVALNGRPAAASAPVRTGDLITVEVADRRIRARVLAVPDTARPDAERYCEVLEDSAQQ
jgi:ribosomal 50S subunit-recycling heat shock protein